MSCPYSEETLAFWDSVANPIGQDCYDCEEYDCEHCANEKKEPDYPDPNFCPFCREPYEVHNPYCDHNPVHKREEIIKSEQTQKKGDSDAKD